MQNLVDALPKAKVAAHAETSAELVDAVRAAVVPAMPSPSRARSA